MKKQVLVFVVFLGLLITGCSAQPLVFNESPISIYSFQTKESHQVLDEGILRDFKFSIGQIQWDESTRYDMVWEPDYQFIVNDTLFSMKHNEDGTLTFEKNHGSTLGTLNKTKSKFFIELLTSITSNAAYASLPTKLFDGYVIAKEKDKILVSGFSSVSPFDTSIKPVSDAIWFSGEKVTTNQIGDVVTVHYKTTSTVYPGNEVAIFIETQESFEPTGTDITYDEFIHTFLRYPSVFQEPYPVIKEVYYTSESDTWTLHYLVQEEAYAFTIQDE